MPPLSLPPGIWLVSPQIIAVQRCCSRLTHRICTDKSPRYQAFSTLYILSSTFCGTAATAPEKDSVCLLQSIQMWPPSPLGVDYTCNPPESVRCRRIETISQPVLNTLQAFDQPPAEAADNCSERESLRNLRKTAPTKQRQEFPSLPTDTLLLPQSLHCYQ